MRRDKSRWEAKKELVNKWIESLDESTAKSVIAVTVMRLIETEEVNIHEENDRGPYWTSCGDSITE